MLFIINFIDRFYNFIVKIDIHDNNSIILRIGSCGK